MKVKVLREFVAGRETYPAGQPAELDDEVAERVIAAGWAESDGPEWPKKTGRDTYELSNGSSVKGKNAAIEEQSKLDISEATKVAEAEAAKAAEAAATKAAEAGAAAASGTQNNNE